MIEKELANLRHLYHLLYTGNVKFQQEIAEKLLSPVIQELEKLRAPVADERAAFEAARQKRDPDAPLGRMCLVNNDEYTNGEDQAAWEGWQDRAVLASAPGQREKQ